MTIASFFNLASLTRGQPAVLSRELLVDAVTHSRSDTPVCSSWESVGMLIVQAFGSCVNVVRSPSRVQVTSKLTS